MDGLVIPVLAASAAALATSVLAWRVLPQHAREYRHLPAEQELLDALRRKMPAPGIYAFPFRGPRGENTTRIDVAANLKRGPVGWVIIGRAGAPRLAWPLVQHFCFLLLISALAALAARISGLTDGARPAVVFRLTAGVSLVSLVLGATPQSIWHGRPWKSLFLQCADGIVCGAAIGGAFAWLWPQ